MTGSATPFHLIRLVTSTVLTFGLDDEYALFHQPLTDDPSRIRFEIVFVDPLEAIVVLARYRQVTETELSCSFCNTSLPPSS